MGQFIIRISDHHCSDLFSFYNSITEKEVDNLLHELDQSRTLGHKTTEDNVTTLEVSSEREVACSGN